MKHWRLRAIHLPIAAAIAFMALTLPTAAGAAAPVQPTQVAAKTTVTRLANHPCPSDPKRTCYATITRTIFPHLAFPRPTPLGHLGTQAHACGWYDSRQIIRWSDWDLPTGLPLDLVVLDATDGFDGCGNSWTDNINSHSCNINVAGISCDGASWGGNYSDPNHGWWNTDWYNQDMSEWVGGNKFESWSLYLRLWTDGYGNTDSGAYCSGSCFGGTV